MGNYAIRSMSYDKYYKTQDYFGEPYPALISFFAGIPAKGKLLDLGCGQGRDAIPIARMGFEVYALDSSKVGIAQMNEIARAEQLSLTGKVADIYEFGNINKFDFVLLDSMFHFAKNDVKKEKAFLQRIFREAKTGALIVICIQFAKNKMQKLIEIIDSSNDIKLFHEEDFDYIFVDKESTHQSSSKYKMIVLKKN